VIPEDPWYQSFVQSADNLHTVQGGFFGEIAALASGATPGGGKYSFSPDQLKAIHSQWVDLQNTLQEAVLNNATTISGTSPNEFAPGNEQASQHISTAITSSNSAYGAYLASMAKYVDDYTAKLGSALQGYTGTEQSVTDATRTIQSEQA
jgi:hypothetical protein